SWRCSSPRPVSSRASTRPSRSPTGPSWAPSPPSSSFRCSRERAGREGRCGGGELVLAVLPLRSRRGRAHKRRPRVRRRERRERRLPALPVRREDGDRRGGRGRVPPRRPRRDRHLRVAVRRVPPVAPRVADPGGELPARRRHDPRRPRRRPAARHLGAAGLRSGFVAVAGRPNVGKSTLVNALTGTKVAIVSDKPHTTRHSIRGVRTTGDAQLVLVDLPGWQRPIDPLTERMQDRVDQAMADDVDAVLLVVNARERIGAGDRYVARHVFALGAPVVIALNKVDRLKPAHIATQMKTAAGLGDFHALHPVSATTGEGIDELRSDLVSLLPEGPLYYPAGTDTDLPLEARIAELVREQELRLTREEVPHALTAELV